MILTILRIMYLRLRNNPLELLLVFVMPVIFFSIFAAIFSNGIATGSDKQLRMAVVCAEQTPVGTELREFLEANSSLQCTSLNDNLSTQRLNDVTVSSLIRDAQNSGRYDLVIKLPCDIPSDTTHAPVQVTLVTDGHNSMAVAMVSSIVKAFFSQKQARAFAAKLLRPQTNENGTVEVAAETSSPGTLAGLEMQKSNDSSFFHAAKTPSDFFSESQIQQLMTTDEYGVIRVGEMAAVVPSRWALQKSVDLTQPQSLNAVHQKVPAPFEIDDDVSLVVENPQAMSQENPRIAMYAAGIAVLFLLFSATGNAAALLEEEESGTLDRILVSKAGLFHIISGKWLGILLLGCVQISVMFLWAEVIFRIQLWQHLDGFAVMTICTAAATSSFAMLLATVCKSRAQLNAASVVIILSMSAVGGSMIPRFVMSDQMQEIGKWTFNAWALDGYQKVFWYQSPVSSLQTEVMVLLGSAVVLGMLTLIFSQRWKHG
ncbi:MAG: ABC transporter permease [Planctomycetota bacterium]|nr:MAG: ABC transporter permease [Planctomycetota bacterium]